jgi:hypothetical protein
VRPAEAAFRAERGILWAQTSVCVTCCTIVLKGFIL